MYINEIFKTEIKIVIIGAILLLLNSGFTQIDSAQTNANDSFEMGLKGGLVYSMIKDIKETFYPDKIMNQYNPFFSLYLEKRIDDISVESNLSYKRLGFEISRSASSGLPSYETKADFHYASVGLSINYYLPLSNSRPKIFLGINYSFLISSRVSYSTSYSSFQVHEDTALKERKKAAIPFFLLGTGINLLRNSHLALELEGEVGLVSPVKEKRYLEGDYMFLPNKFKFVNIYLVFKLQDL